MTIQPIQVTELGTDAEEALAETRSRMEAPGTVPTHLSSRARERGLGALGPGPLFKTSVPFLPLPYPKDLVL